MRLTRFLRGGAQTQCGGACQVEPAAVGVCAFPPWAGTFAQPNQLRAYQGRPLAQSHPKSGRAR